MSPYVMLLVALVFAACLSARWGLSRGVVFALYIVMTVMTCLRYGQGTDFQAYEWIFNSVANAGRVSFSRIFTAAMQEPLYLVLCYVVSLFGDFQMFVAILSAVEMAMMWMFIRRTSSNPALSVLIFASVTWMIYFLSALRQGLAVSIFLGYGTGLIERREWRKYLVMCLLLMGIHTVSVIFLAVPVVLKFSVRSMMRVVMISPVIGVAFLFIGGMGIIPYSREASIRFIALAERVLSFAVIWLVYVSFMRGGGVSNDWWMKLYCFGMSLYFIFMAFSNVASRTAICFKALEIMIVPKLIERRSRYRQMLIVYIIALSAVMFIHSIISELNNGHYNSSITPITYPYVSVFSADDISSYRESRFDKMN